MAIPIIEDRTCTIGGYCVGAVAEFELATMHLKVGPGIFKLNEQMGRYEFPGAELDLPPDTVDVWMLRGRASGQAVVGVNVGQGIDDLSYEPIERIVHLERDGWCVVMWIPDLEQWSGVIPNPETVRGPDAPVITFDEMPAHLKRALDIRYRAEQAANLHRIERGKKWKDAKQEEVIRGIMDRLEALDRLEEAANESHPAPTAPP